MAATYTALTAFTFAQKMISTMVLTDVEYDVLDDICKIMWMAAPWRWTLGSLPTIGPLVSGTTDYTATKPTDFLKIQDAFLTDGSNTSDLHVEALTATPLQSGQPSCVYHITGNTWRLFPKPWTQQSGRSWNVMGRYKKAAPSITVSTVSTAGALTFDDEYYPVFRMGVLALASSYAYDQRGGDVQFLPQSGQCQMTGYWGRFYHMLEDMRQKEGLPIERSARPADLIARNK